MSRRDGALSLLLRWTQHRGVPLFARCVLNRLPSCRSSPVKWATLGKQRPRASLSPQMAVSREDGAACRHPRCTHLAQYFTEGFSFGWLRWKHAAYDDTHQFGCPPTRVYDAQHCVNAAERRISLAPYIVVFPHFVPEPAVQLFVRAKTTGTAQSVSIAAATQPKGTPKLANARSTRARKAASGSEPGDKKSRSQSDSQTAKKTRSKRTVIISETGGEKPQGEAETPPAKKTRTRKTERIRNLKNEKPQNPPKQRILAKSVDEKTQGTKEKKPGSTSELQGPPKRRILAKSVGEKPQGTEEKKPGSTSRKANAEKIPRSALMQRGSGDSNAKEVSQRSARGDGNQRGDFKSSIPVPPESFFEFRYSRSSKPGGSSANKNETKVALHVPLKALETFYEVPMDKLVDDPRAKLNKKGELIIASEKHASQALNRKECMQKLDSMLNALHELYVEEERKTPYTIDEETQRRYKFNILVRKKKAQYHRKCSQVNVRDL